MRAGGSLVVASHLRGRHPLRRLVEDGLDHLTRRLGWRSNFDPGLIVGRPGLRLVVERRLPPFGLVTLLRLERQGEEPSP
ncbi:MAG: hypothetical protein KatS3mg124_2283 [Porticoccaceae bacterium]|nr:MAG: hypothetical protein KatS3mg124_2283 [Porticoccaceae bacterium]